MLSESQLLGALSRHWGYTLFRPGQKEIARSIVDGRDACVVMPTGGGKSLCYQLPAALAEGRTAVVISPLIALMQDQVAQLDEMGIPAAAINSTLAPSQKESVRREATKRGLPAFVPFAGIDRAGRYSALAQVAQLPFL